MKVRPWKKTMSGSETIEIMGKTNRILGYNEKGKKA